MLPVVTPSEMREVDANAQEPLDELIARAGWHVARRARAMLGGVYGRRVSVLAGPGNNGADARVAAQILERWGVRVEVVTPDVAHLPAADLIIDGAFGTGMNRPYTAPEVPATAMVLAIDIPSGVNGLTGEVSGQPMTADHTLTFAALKPGLLLSPGVDYCGDIEVVDIGLDVSDARVWQMTKAAASELLPRRSTTDHKWKRAVWVIGGSRGMFGAPLLAARAALRSGAGMVWCGLPGQTPPGIASEIVFVDLDAKGWDNSVLDDGARFGAVVVGCGLGRDEAAAISVRAVTSQSSRPLVIDGDALRLLGPNPTLRSDIVLTPHDGEFEALTGTLPQQDRFEATRALARSTGATVLLKGPLTIAASPDGRCIASSTGDQRLATAGTGDVLAGLVGSYLAGGVPPLEAAALAAWIHGESGRLQSPVGMVASDLLDGISQVAEHLLSKPAHPGDVHAPN